jgi:hypothetical protein
VQHVAQISSETCRSRAALRFDARRMVNDYLSLYRKVQQTAASCSLFFVGKPSDFED